VLWIRIRFDLASEYGSVLGIWDSDPGARKLNKKQISLNLDLSKGFLYYLYYYQDKVYFACKNFCGGKIRLESGPGTGSAMRKKVGSLSALKLRIHNTVGG